MCVCVCVFWGALRYLLCTCISSFSAQIILISHPCYGPPEALCIRPDHPFFVHEYVSKRVCMRKQRHYPTGLQSTLVVLCY